MRNTTNPADIANSIATKTTTIATAFLNYEKKLTKYRKSTFTSKHQKNFDNSYSKEEHKRVVKYFWNLKNFKTGYRT